MTPYKQNYWKGTSNGAHAGPGARCHRRTRPVVKIWHRRFAEHPILTHLEPADETRTPVVVERFRFGVTFALQITERHGSLRFELRGIRLCEIPMPRFLWPLLDAEERAERGGFRFDIDIALRGFGRLIRYRG